MTELRHNGRRRRGRAGRHIMQKDLITLDLTPEEILTQLEPNWFHGQKDGERDGVQVRTGVAAA